MTVSLSKNERLVAYSAQFRARASIAALSKMTGLRTHSVRYALEKLLERRVLKPYSFIDSESLGYTAYNVLCALSSHRLEVRQRFEDTLLKHENVAGAYQIGGDFHYRVVILAQSTRSLLDIMDNLFGSFGEIVFERSFVIRCGAWLFSRRYLNPKGRPAPPLHVEPCAEIKSLDEADSKILQALGHEGTWQTSQLAANLAMPISTVEYRLRRLERSGIIKAWVYSIDAGLFGMHDYKLHVTVKQVDHPTHKALLAFCSKHPHVYSLVRCIGSWDYEIGIEVESREKVVEIVQSIYETFNTQLRSIKSIPIFHALKTSMYPHR